MLTDDQMAEVLSAAVLILDLDGLANTRMEEIASMAGVTLVELNTRFSGPEEMLRRVVQQAVVEPIRRATEELPAGTAAEELKNFAGRAWEIINTPAFARIYRIVMAEVPHYPELARFFAQEVAGPARAQLEKIIARGIARGEFRHVAPAAVARALTGSLLSQAFWCNHAELWGESAGAAPSRVIPETLSLMLDGLNRPAAPSPFTDGRMQ